MSNIKIFNKWSIEGIEVSEPGLKRYVTVQGQIAPKTGARYAGKRFHKSKVFIVERLINRIMVSGHKAKKHLISSGHNSGKAVTAYNIVQGAFQIIEERTKENPVKVFVKAVENAAPREEIITIEYGGARYPKAVEAAPQRRVDMVLKLMTQATYQKSFNTKKSAEQALADEILNMYTKNQNSATIAKKNELERQADSSR